MLKLSNVTTTVDINMKIFVQSRHSFSLAELTSKEQDLAAQMLSVLVEVSDHLRLSLEHVHHLVRADAANHLAV